MLLLHDWRQKSQSIRNILSIETMNFSFRQLPIPNYVLHNFSLQTEIKLLIEWFHEAKDDKRMWISHTVYETFGSDSGCASELSSTTPATADSRDARFGATTVAWKILGLYKEKERESVIELQRQLDPKKQNPKIKRREKIEGNQEKGIGTGDLESAIEGFVLEAEMGMKELGHRRELMGFWGFRAEEAR